MSHSIYNSIYATVPFTHLMIVHFLSGLRKYSKTVCALLVLLWQFEYRCCKIPYIPECQNINAFKQTMIKLLWIDRSQRCEIEKKGGVGVKFY